MDDIDYKQYLSSEQWKKTRTRIRRRARGWCERCKVGKRRDIHHLSYERLGHERLEDLIAVCQYCHEFLHGKRKKDPAETTYTKDEIKYVREVAEMAAIGCKPDWWVGSHPRLRAAWQKRQASLQEGRTP